MLKSAPQSDRLCTKELFGKSSKSGKIAVVCSSWFGVGFLPGAPGTAASAIAVPLAFFLKRLGFWQECGFLAALLLIAFWACGRAWRMAEKDDPQWIVIDEVIGLLLTFLALRVGIQDLVIGFILFRIFDILKPYPVGKMERLPGATGILMDDVLAGVYANLCLRLFQLIG
ncbi:MAG: phosphatidylglycerophosphatase A [Deltaproteobacteria bacterium HGW-Deltaproteobacteria-15]|nr:MAG: phosphatidylglycerophosphatase A [Deltaproteobacteria bacterium HGW-Deltaproteobacteria-15]